MNTTTLICITAVFIVVAVAATALLLMNKVEQRESKSSTTTLPQNTMRHSPHAMPLFANGAKGSLSHFVANSDAANGDVVNSAPRLRHKVAQGAFGSVEHVCANEPNSARKQSVPPFMHFVPPPQLFERHIVVISSDDDEKEQQTARVEEISDESIYDEPETPLHRAPPRKESPSASSADIDIDILKDNMPDDSEHSIDIDMSVD